MHVPCTCHAPTVHLPRACSAFRKAECLEGVLAPGETLYYPEDYWHQVSAGSGGSGSSSSSSSSSSSGNPYPESPAPPDAEPRRGGGCDLGHARHALQRRPRRRRATLRVQRRQQVALGLVCCGGGSGAVELGGEGVALHDPCMILSTRHDPCCMCTSALDLTAESSRAARRSCVPRSPPASPAGRRSRAARRSQPRLRLRRGGPPPGQCRRSEGLQTDCREANVLTQRTPVHPVHGAGRAAYERFLHTVFIV